jgi:hypothetical protein
MSPEPSISNPVHLKIKIVGSMVDTMANNAQHNVDVIIALLIKTIPIDEVSTPWVFIHLEGH